jgi:hypothetical protein
MRSLFDIVLNASVLPPPPPHLLNQRELLIVLIKERDIYEHASPAAIVETEWMVG